jgi:predicted HicB family RNase H-like nuclease
MPKPDQSKKPSKRGRPPLPKGDAKAIMLRVRITPDELRAVEVKAKKNNQTVSEWVRSTVNAAIGL